MYICMYYKPFDYNKHPNAEQKLTKLLLGGDLVTVVPLGAYKKQDSKYINIKLCRE